MVSRYNGDQIGIDIEKGAVSPESVSPTATEPFFAYRGAGFNQKSKAGATGGLFASARRLYQRNPKAFVRGRYRVSFRQIVSVAGIVLGMIVVWSYINKPCKCELEDTSIDCEQSKNAKKGSPSSLNNSFIYPGFEPQPGDPPTARDRWERVRGKGTRSSLKKIQFDFKAETESEKATREQRRLAVRDAFLHAWNGGGAKDNFGGWGATMIDSLDTMLIMGLNKEFDEALEWVKTKFSMTRNPTAELQFFETVIRYLGGLLAAYDLSGEKILLAKAEELGNIMLNAFKHSDFPASRVTVDIDHQPSSSRYVLAEIGTIQVEFTRLSRLTGNPIYENKARKVFDILGSQTSEISGLLPEFVSPHDKHHSNFRAHIGGMTDSYYEYLLKEWILLDVEQSMDSTDKYLVSRPSDGSKEYAIIGHTQTATKSIEPLMEHLACFIGGSLAMGSVYYDRPNDMVLARQITESCYLSYHHSTTGLGPENFKFQSTQDSNGKFFDSRLPGTYYEHGWSDTKYILRPETLESLWILYRLTGDKKYPEQAWEIFQSLERSCKTSIAYSALSNVNIPGSHSNNMESFFLAETLKYLYLMFSTPDVISLDDFVLNTEAHPLRRM
ncbi:hypothetical protein BGW41_000752 [Actinomortierella wolfii]|nr:hypothetical protein BGW41_000752 [Actinomortierella wolfii]